MEQGKWKKTKNLAEALLFIGLKLVQLIRSGLLLIWIQNIDFYWFEVGCIIEAAVALRVNIKSFQLWVLSTEAKLMDCCSAGEGSNQIVICQCHVGTTNIDSSQKMWENNLKNISWSSKYFTVFYKHRHRRNVTSHHFTSFLFTSFHFYVYSNFLSIERQIQYIYTYQTTQHFPSFLFTSHSHVYYQLKGKNNTHTQHKAIQKVQSSSSHILTILRYSETKDTKV